MTRRYTAEQHAKHDSSKWDIDKKDPAPGGIFNQPTSENRTHCRGDRCEARPRTNGSPALLCIKRGADDGKTPWHQQCATYALHCPRSDQEHHVRRKATAC